MRPRSRATNKVITWKVLSPHFCKFLREDWPQLDIEIDKLRVLCDLVDQRVSKETFLDPKIERVNQ